MQSKASTRRAAPGVAHVHEGRHMQCLGHALLPRGKQEGHTCCPRGICDLCNALLKPVGVVTAVVDAYWVLGVVGSCWIGEQLHRACTASFLG